MISRQSLAVVIIFGSSLMACTAIVLGQVGDKKDYNVGNADSPGASSGAGACSLLTPQNNYSNGDYPDNECAQCINTECAEDVKYACADGKTKKDWFTNLASCAQNPWIEYAPRGSSGSFYECGLYQKENPPIDDNSDQHYRRKSEICVHDKCMQDPGKKCQLCAVSIEATSSSGDSRPLANDECGSCFTDNCNAVIAECCKSRVIDDYVRHCANTPDPDQLEICKKIGDADGGAVAEEHGSNSYGNQYSEDEWTCVGKLAECWNSFCKKKSKCK